LQRVQTSPVSAIICSLAIYTEDSMQTLSSHCRIRNRKMSSTKVYDNQTSDLIIIESPYQEMSYGTVPGAPQQTSKKRQAKVSNDPRLRKVRRKLAFEEEVNPIIDVEKITEQPTITKTEQPMITKPILEQLYPLEEASAKNPLTLPYMLRLGRNRFLSVKEWNGAVQFHIRIFREELTGRKNNEEILIPTKHGMVFSVEEIANLLLSIEMIEKGISTMPTEENCEVLAFHMGNGKYFRLNSFQGHIFVDFRRYWQPQDRPIPTRNGITLRLMEWNMFVNSIDNLKRLVPELETVTPCILSESHQNQQGYMECSFCNPFGQ